MIKLIELRRGRYGGSYNKEAINNYSWREYVALKNDYIWGGILIERCTDISPTVYKAYEFAIDSDLMMDKYDGAKIDTYEGYTWSRVEKEVSTWIENFKGD